MHSINENKSIDQSNNQERRFLRKTTAALVFVAAVCMAVGTSIVSTQHESPSRFLRTSRDLGLFKGSLKGDNTSRGDNEPAGDGPDDRGTGNTGGSNGGGDTGNTGGTTGGGGDTGNTGGGNTGGGGNTDGSGTTGGTGGSTGGSTGCPAGWKAASWTWYQSYAPCCPGSPNYDPTADTTECDQYSACDYTGSFAYIGQRSFDYVKNNNIIALFSANGDNDSFARKRVRVSAMGKTIETFVADTCGDSDCGGCCTRNSHSTSGYLVDMEYQTVLNNFGSTDNAHGEVCMQVVDEGDLPAPTGYCNWSNCNGKAEGGDYCNFDDESCQTSCGGSWCAF